MLLLALIIHTGMFLLVSLSFKEEYKRTVRDAVYSADNIAFLFSTLYQVDPVNSIQKMNQAAKTYEKSGEHVQVLFLKNGTKTWELFVNLLPYDISWKDGLPLWDEEQAGTFYCGIQSEKRTAGGILRVIYLKDVTPLHGMQYDRILLAMLIVLASGVTLAFILYKIMQQIYKPISNIAHELRTPLTSIRGYAQFIKAGKVSGEDIFFAGEQMEKDAAHLQDIIEKLLVMGNVREGHIRQEQFDVKELFIELKTTYPTIHLEDNLGIVTGDRTLFNCMLRNLVDNAARECEIVRVGRSDDTIWIVNDGAVVTAQLLLALNQNQELSMEQVKGNGYGLALCHEIAKVHQMKLVYEDIPNGGMRVNIKPN